MSLKSFYQTFYQHEQLYRLPGETFAPVAFRSLEPLQETADVLVVEPDDVGLLRPAKPENELVAEIPNLIQQTEALRPILPVVESVALPPAAVLPPAVPQTWPVASPKIRHKVLLLADEELDPSSLLFLEKILNAVNLDITGVDLLNLHGVSDIDFATVLRDKHIHHFITFGVPFERVGLDIMMDRYQPVRFEGITFLIADALPVIEANQKLKRALWEALKRVFQNG